MLEASQNDSYSYLFTKPTFISLDPNASDGSIPIKGVRIGVNGAEARVGQAYVPLAATVSSSNYFAGTGQLLSPVGTIIALEKGPQEFGHISARSSPASIRRHLLCGEQGCLAVTPWTRASLRAR
jgi:hypothetical protein